MSERIRDGAVWMGLGSLFLILFRILMGFEVHHQRTYLLLATSVVALVVFLLSHVDFSVFNTQNIFLLCATLTSMSLVQFWGFYTFFTTVYPDPSRVNVIDFETLFENEAERPLSEVEYDLDLPFVTSEIVEEGMSEANGKKRLGLFTGIIGGIGVFIVSYLAWRSLLASVVSMLLGPIGIAYAINLAAHRADRSSRVPSHRELEFPSR